MKKITLTYFILLAGLACNAQTATSLNEDFNTKCLSAAEPGYGWAVYNNPVGRTFPDSAWQCTPTDGRPTTTGTPTPGMMCTSVHSGTYYLDTSYLISPLLYFGSLTPRPAHLYLDFDSKVTNIFLGGRLAVMETNVLADTPIFRVDSVDQDLTGAMLPVFGEGDSSGWVTHQVDITNLLDSTVLYIGFRYTGTTTSGSTWYLDNVNTSTTDLSVSVTGIHSGEIPLAVVGQSTESQINILFSVPSAGKYQLDVYDMLGRAVHKETLMANGGHQAYAISGLSLQSGMYVIKMSDERNFAVTKAQVQ